MTVDIDAVIKEAQKDTKDTIIKVRVSSKQKTEFIKACEHWHVDSSSMIRSFMQQCIEKEDK